VALWLAAGAAFAPGDARAQQGPPQPVRWSLALDPASGQVAAGGKLYRGGFGEDRRGLARVRARRGQRRPRPVEITIVKGQVFAAAGRFDVPEPVREMDQAFGQITASYVEQAKFRLPVGVAPDAPPGAHPLEIDISFQACDGNICLPAKAARVKATVTVTK